MRRLLCCRWKRAYDAVLICSALAFIFPFIILGVAEASHMTLSRLLTEGPFQP